MIVYYSWVEHFKYIKMRIVFDKINILTSLINKNGQNSENKCKQADIYIYIKWLYFILWLNKWLFTVIVTIFSILIWNRKKRHWND